MEQERGDIAVVLGTRPEIVKLAGVIRILGSRAWVIDTGQHYDDNLNAIFFDAFGIARPADVLGIGGGTRGAQIGHAVARLDALFGSRPPAAVVVQGDTNSALSGAIAANAREAPLAHVEAGLRSFDRAMPEEHNRVLIDHLADLCLAPTDVSVGNLLREGVDRTRVAETGNTVVEAVRELVPPPAERRALLGRYGLEPDSFVLSTFHRPENVDDPARLSGVLGALASVPATVVLPLHPRTRARASAFGLDGAMAKLMVVDPLGYRDFIGLVAECALVIGDSGGLQEEVSVLKRPMIVVRRSTERPEVLGTFAQLISEPEAIAHAAESVLSAGAANLARLKELPNPYGDGEASAISADLVVHLADDR